MGKNSGILRRKTDTRTLASLSTPQRYSIKKTKGLHLWVTAAGHKYWILRYTTSSGVRKETSLGTFPIVTLDEAIEKVLAIRKKLLNGESIQTKHKLIKQGATTFQAFATQYFEQVKNSWTNEKHRKDWIQSLEKHVHPTIGNKPISEVDTKDTLAVLLPIWTAKHETATRVLGRIQKILSAANTLGLRSGLNPATYKDHLENLLPKIKVTIDHYRAMPYQELPILIEELKKLQTMTSLALQFIICTATRTNEVLGVKKQEITEDLWVIPKERTKTKIVHTVPLSNYAREIVEKAMQLSSADTPLLFVTENGEQLRKDSMIMLLRKLRQGFTVHGFRSSFKDWSIEQTDYPNELSEQALGHIVGNSVERAYRRTNMLEKRKILMNDWSSFLNINMIQ